MVAPEEGPLAEVERLAEVAGRRESRGPEGRLEPWRRQGRSPPHGLLLDGLSEQFQHVRDRRAGLLLQLLQLPEDLLAHVRLGNLIEQQLRIGPLELPGHPRQRWARWWWLILKPAWISPELRDYSESG